VLQAGATGIGGGEEEEEKKKMMMMIKMLRGD
jgi:hypothetical protein